MNRRSNFAILLLLFTQAAISFDYKRQCHLAYDKVKNWIHRPAEVSDTSPPNFIDLFNRSFKKLGEGNFGVVKEVHANTKPSIKLAVKRVKTAEVNAQELQVLSDLSGKNISPSFHACFRDTHHLYLAQEMLYEKLDEQTTQTLIRRKTDKEIFRFFKSLFDGLLNMFSAGYMHNDVKPANIMADKKLSKIYLIDFGLAQRKNPSIAVHGRPQAMTFSNNFSGTPLFMSFTRQISRNASPFDDLYAAALTVAEILSSNNDIFSRVTHPCSTRTCRLSPLCFRRTPRDSLSPFKSVGQLQQFCLDNLKQNVIDSVSRKFGDYVSGATPENINFTTFLAKLMNYESYNAGSSPLTLTWVRECLDGMAKTLKIDEAPQPQKNARDLFAEKEASEDQDFKNSRKLNEQKKLIADEQKALRRQALELADKNPKLLEELEKKMDQNLKKMQNIEHEHLHNSNVWQDNKELFDRVKLKDVKKDKPQRGVEKPAKMLQKEPLEDKAKQPEEIRKIAPKVELPRQKADVGVKLLGRENARVVQVNLDAPKGGENRAKVAGAADINKRDLKAVLYKADKLIKEMKEQTAEQKAQLKHEKFNPNQKAFLKYEPALLKKDAKKQELPNPAIDKKKIFDAQILDQKDTQQIIKNFDELANKLKQEMKEEKERLQMDRNPIAVEEKPKGLSARDRQDLPTNAGQQNPPLSHVRGYSAIEANKIAQKHEERKDAFRKKEEPPKVLHARMLDLPQAQDKNFGGRIEGQREYSLLHRKPTDQVLPAKGSHPSDLKVWALGQNPQVGAQHVGWHGYGPRFGQQQRPFV